MGQGQHHMTFTLTPTYIVQDVYYTMHKHLLDAQTTMADLSALSLNSLLGAIT